MPSAKKALAGSGLRFSNGSTASRSTDGRARASAPAAAPVATRRATQRRQARPPTTARPRRARAIRRGAGAAARAVGRRRQRLGFDGRRGGRPFDRADEAIALARHRLQVLRRLGILGEGGAQLPHRGVEAGVEVDDGVRPQPRRQLFAGDQLARLAHQRFQDLQRLLLELDRLLAAEQLQRRPVQRPAVESRHQPRGSVRHAASLPEPTHAGTRFTNKSGAGSARFHGAVPGIGGATEAFTGHRRSPCTLVSHPRSIVCSSR